MTYCKLKVGYTYFTVQQLLSKQTIHLKAQLNILRESDRKNDVLIYYIA